MSDVMNAPTRRSLDGDRFAYAIGKVQRGYPPSAVARMIGVCEADLRERMRPLEVRPAQRPLSVPEIFRLTIDAVAQETGIDPRRLENPAERAKDVVRARQDVMWRLVQLKTPEGAQRLSLTNIARRLGFKDHGTVLSGARAHAARMAAQ